MTLIAIFSFITPRFLKIHSSDGVSLFLLVVKFMVFHSEVKRICNTKKPVPKWGFTPATSSMLLSCLSKEDMRSGMETKSNLFLKYNKARL